MEPSPSSVVELDLTQTSEHSACNYTHYRGGPGAKSAGIRAQAVPAAPQPFRPSAADIARQSAGQSPPGQAPPGQAVRRPAAAGKQKGAQTVKSVPPWRWSVIGLDELGFILAARRRLVGLFVNRPNFVGGAQPRRFLRVARTFGPQAPWRFDASDSPESVGGCISAAGGRARTCPSPPEARPRSPPGRQRLPLRSNCRNGSIGTRITTVRGTCWV